MGASAIDALLQALGSPASTDADLNAAAQALFRSLRGAAPAAVAQNLAQLGAALQIDDPLRAGYAAMIIGAVLEQGHPADSVAQPLIERLGQILGGCAALATECHRLLSARGMAEQDRADAFAEVLPEAVRIAPGAAQAWEALDLFWPPGIALFSCSVAARRDGAPLRSLAQPLSEHHEGARWLDLMLSTLIDEPLLVIEPESRQGLQGTMTGVVDNFQLHTLLMDTFPAKGFRRRVSRRIADVARGRGPQQLDDTVAGAWNMYAWTAIQPGIQLPAPNDRAGSQHWIWGEGQPADIPVFEGFRTVLLGPPSYIRSWQAQRIFGGMAADLRLSALQRHEVDAWLSKMAEAGARS